MKRGNDRFMQREGTYNLESSSGYVICPSKSANYANWIHSYGPCDKTVKIHLDFSAIIYTVKFKLK